LIIDPLIYQSVDLPTCQLTLLSAPAPGARMNAQLFAKAERQLRVVREDMEKLKGEGEEGGVGEVVAGLATAMLTLRSLEDSLSRETAMEKRQQGKQ
jgi:hypothetical protein